MSDQKNTSLPPTVQLVLPSTHAVLPGGFTRHAMQPNYYTHDPSTATLSHPHDFTKPFVAHHPNFLSLLGPNPTLTLIASTEEKYGGDGSPLFHEAGVWVEDSQEVWFTSNLLRDPDHNEVGRVKVDGREGEREVGKSWRLLTEEERGRVVTGNGATLYGGEVLYCSQGMGTEVPSALVAQDPKTLATRVLLNNYHGRPFNSVNDVVVLPGASGATSRTDLHADRHTTIWFTDPTYGHAQAYKPAPLLPNQVYCFHPASGTTRCVASFDSTTAMPNGLCFSHDGAKLYVTNTACINAHEEVGEFSVRSNMGGEIWEYAVLRPEEGVDYAWEGPTLGPRRLFAFVDGGAPDGIKTDTLGNIWTSTVDGLQAFNPHGTLIGKIAIFPDEVPDRYPSDHPSHKIRHSANFCFLPGGRVCILAEDRIYLAQLDAGQVKGSLLP